MWPQKLRDDLLQVQGYFLEQDYIPIIAWNWIHSKNDFVHFPFNQKIPILWNGSKLAEFCWTKFLEI